MGQGPTLPLTSALLTKSKYSKSMKEREREREREREVSDSPSNRATSFESIDVHSSINVLNWLQNIFILILVVLTPTSILFIDLLKMQVRKGLYGYLGWNILGLFYFILFYFILLNFFH